MKRTLNVMLLIIGVLIAAVAVKATCEAQVIPAMGLFIVSIVVFYIRYELSNE